MHAPKMTDKVAKHYNNNALDVYADGGYPLYYVTEGNNVLCPTHATMEWDYDDEKIVDVDINYEDDDLWCEHGHKIESAYGDN